MEASSYSKGNFWLKVILIGIIFIFILGWFKGCFDRDTATTIEITRPIVKGVTTISKPESQPLEDNYTTGPHAPNQAISSNNTKTSQSQKDADRWKYIADSLLNENVRMQVAFAKSKNKDSLYKLAITPKQFLKTWDDENLTATVKGMSMGTVAGLQLDYIIKEQKQTINLPQSVFRLIAGGEVGMNKGLNQCTWKVNLTVQDKNNNLWNASFQQIAGQQYYLAGFQKSIFSIKR